MANEVAKLIFKAETKELLKAEKILDRLGDSANDASKDVDRLGDESKAAGRKVDKLGKESKQTGQQVGAMGKAAGSARGKLAGMASALVGVGSAMAFGSKFVRVNEEFAIMNAMLLSATGSAEAASIQFEKIKEFAATTPFALDQSVNGFVMLKNLGLDPSMESMNSFGNTAAAMGRSLQQMIEAVAAASTMEFERLKLFGIKAKQQTDTVSFTFQGTTTVVEKEADAIVGFLKSIGDEKFGDAMQLQAASFAGALSNLGDEFDNLFREAGAGGALDEATEKVLQLKDGLASEEMRKGVGALSSFFVSLVGIPLDGVKALGTLLDRFEKLKFVGGGGLLPQLVSEGEVSETLALAGAARALDQDIVNATERVAYLQKVLAEKQGFFAIKQAKQNLDEAKASLNAFILARDGAQPFDMSQMFGGVNPLEPEQPFSLLDPNKKTPSVSVPMADPSAIGVTDFVSPAEQAAIDEKERLKEIELEFQEWKDGFDLTDLDRMKERHLAEIEATETTARTVMDIEKRKKDGILSTNMMLMNGIAGLLKKSLGDSKAAAIAGVAIDAAMAAGKVLATGAASAANIQLTYKQLAAAAMNPSLIGVGDALAATSLAQSKALAVKTAAIQFGLGSAGIAIGGGGGGGGGASAGSVADTMPIQPAIDEPVVQAPQAINVTVDGSIDPTGARRIIEAINEATEDGLEINALVGT